MNVCARLPLHRALFYELSGLSKNLASMGAFVFNYMRTSSALTQCYLTTNSLLSQY